MAAKRGAKRAASSGTGKKRGRPSKKAKEEDTKEQDSKEAETTDEQQQDAAKDSTNDSSEQKDTTQQHDTSAQSADDAKTDDANAATKDTAAEGGQEEYKAEEMEKGRLYFFYRPKVDAKEVKGTGDVQKFYILISPDGAEGTPAKEHEIEGKRHEEREAGKQGAEGGKQHRLLVVSSKTLPPPGQRVRNPWSFVDAVGTLDEIEHKLERYSYDTKTKGQREIQPARLCGEARYELIKTTHKNSAQTHLVYELEVPEQPGEVQQAFSIAKEGQFLINVKNPDFNSAARSTRPYAGFKEEEKAKIPSHLMDHFAGKRQAEVRYAPVMSTEFLDLYHAELVMIGVKKGVKDESGEEFQRLVSQLEEDVEADEPKDAGDALDELKMDEKEHPAAIDEFK